MFYIKTFFSDSLLNKRFKDTSGSERKNENNSHFLWSSHFYIWSSVYFDIRVIYLMIFEQHHDFDLIFNTLFYKVLFFSEIFDTGDWSIKIFQNKTKKQVFQNNRKSDILGPLSHCRPQDPRTPGRSL